MVAGSMVALLLMVAWGPLPCSAQVLKNRQRPGLGNEIEGAVYQYKATRRSSDGEQKLEGKIRISENAIFEIPMRRLAPGREKRVGDIISSRDEVQLVFNDFDQLEGRAHLKKDKDQKKGLFAGYFVDQNKARWKFELRKTED